MSWDLGVLNFKKVNCVILAMCQHLSENENTLMMNGWNI
jgi:hypothetical protein